MGKLRELVDSRTGLGKLLEAAFDEEIRGGARWAYVFGSTLAVLLLSQAVTGALMMMVYVPSTHDAWSSVFYIQHRMAMGWLVRGLHHYGAQAVMIVMGLHLTQVALYGAYKKPREVNWWLGVVLLFLVVLMADTGYHLPWDQKGYWAAAVAGGIAGSSPGIGPTLQELFLGGSQQGQGTLSRVFAIHVAIVPALMAGLLLLHVLLFRRHGPTAPANADLDRKSTYLAQAARDVIVSALVLGTLAALSAWMPAGLDAPADPNVDYPARPEWYFLWLSHLMELLGGDWEFLASLGVPAVTGLFLFALPLIDRGASTRVRERLPFVLPVLLGGLGIVGLTAHAVTTDGANEDFVTARADADRRAARAITLAHNGVPPGGPLEMLRNDPLTEGRDLYARHCAVCHVLDGEGERSAPEHTGFGSRAWTLAMMHDPDGARFFGTTELDDMPSQTRLGDDVLRPIAEFLFAKGVEPQDAAHVDEALAARGAPLFESKCMGCHTFEGDGDFDGLGGPDLTGYASRWWIHEMIVRPEHAYATGNEMPSFAEDLDAHSVQMVAAWLRLQRFEEPASGPVTDVVPVTREADAGAE